MWPTIKVVQYQAMLFFALLMNLQSAVKPLKHVRSVPPEYVLSVVEVCPFPTPPPVKHQLKKIPGVQ